MLLSRKLWIVACLLLTACKERNSLDCVGHPDDLVNCPRPDSGQCTGDEQCSGQVCNTSSGACVACTPTRADACMATTPVCGDDGACTGCTDHAQCAASNVCLPSGACADATEVAYVSASGSSTACTQAAPCPRLATAIALNLPYVKIAAAGAQNDTSTIIIDGQAVTILAEPGAKLDRDGDGPILEVRSANADVTIYDLQITGASGQQGGDGILLTPNNGAPKLHLARTRVDNHQGRGIATTGGALTVSQSTIASNPGGGISVLNGTFEIVGNVFFANGTQSSLQGALVISAPANSTNRLEFNSFNLNAATNGVAPAIQCTSSGVFTARNNIMSGNGTLTNMEQVGGTCTHAYSIARPGSVPAGTGNSAVDPQFADTMTGDLHLMATSPARGVADPSSDLGGLAAFDLDGDPRTSPADLGADQHVP